MFTIICLKYENTFFFYTLAIRLKVSVATLIKTLEMILFQNKEGILLTRQQHLVIAGKCKALVHHPLRLLILAQRTPREKPGHISSVRY